MVINFTSPFTVCSLDELSFTLLTFVPSFTLHLVATLADELMNHELLSIAFPNIIALLIAMLSYCHIVPINKVLLSLLAMYPPSNAMASQSPLGTVLQTPNLLSHSFTSLIIYYGGRYSKFPAPAPTNPCHGNDMVVRTNTLT